jgi:type I restriction enzyme S subunit
VQPALVELEQTISGTTVKHLSTKDLRRLTWQLPPLDEQRRIAEVLRSVDEAIAAQRATCNQHTCLMEAVFEAWSNQSAPMEALGDLLDLKNGINFEKDERADEGTLTLDVMNMFSDDMTPTYEGAYRISKVVPSDLILQSGDVLFVRSSVKQQGVGWASLADGFVENTTFCGFIIRGRPKRADVLSRYVVGVLRAPKYRRWLIQHSTRSALTNINQKTIASAEIPLPAIEQQQRLVEQYEQIAHAAFEASAALVKLERLRLDLANGLLSGRVRVPA